MHGPVQAIQEYYELEIFSREQALKALKVNGVADGKAESLVDSWAVRPAPKVELGPEQIKDIFNLRSKKVLKRINRKEENND